MPHAVSSSVGHEISHAAIRFAAGWRVSAEGYCAMHHHPTLEIVYHTRGRGTSRTDQGQILDFGPRDVTIYPPLVPHDQINHTAGEDRCVHLYADGLDMNVVPCMTLSRPNDPYVVRELTALSEAGVSTGPLQTSWYNHRAHALLACLLFWVDQHGKACNADTACNYAECAFDHIANHAGAIRQLSEVADHVGVSHDYLRHIFRRRYGMSLKRWHVLARIELAKKLLAYSAVPIKAIAGECGFVTDRHFCSCFRAETGMTPTGYRQRQCEPGARRGRREIGPVA